MPSCYYCNRRAEPENSILRPNGNVWHFCDECWGERKSEEAHAKIVDGMTLTEMANAGVL